MPPGTGSPNLHQVENEDNCFGGFCHPIEENKGLGRGALGKVKEEEELHLWAVLSSLSGHVTQG